MPDAKAASAPLPIASASPSADAPLTFGVLTTVVRGTVWSVVASGVAAGVSFLVTPFTLRLFGPEQYGIWAILTTIISYFGFADIGMGTASTRFATEAHHQGDSQREADVIWTSLVVGFTSAAIFALLLSLCAGGIVSVLIHGSPQFHQQAAMGLRFAGLVFLGYVLSNVLNTAELVRLRIGLFSSISTGAAILQITLVPIVLTFGGGLRGAAATLAALALLTAIVHGLVGASIFPQLWTGRVRKVLISPLLLFGAPLVFSFFAEMALLASDKLVLARVAGPRAVAHYAVAASFAALLAIVPQSLSRAMIPAFGRYLAVNDTDSLNTFFARAIRGNILWLAPAVLAGWIICRPFLALWAGAEYGRESWAPALILLVGCAVDAVSLLPARLLVASGRTKNLALLYSAQVPIFLLAAFLLAQRYGIIGVAVAWTSRSLVNSVLLFRKVKPIVRLQHSPIAGRHAMFLLALTPLAVAFALRSPFLPGVELRFVAAASGTIAYVAIIWKTVLSHDERHWLHAFVTGRIGQGRREAQGNL
jgi:O-antigen/teichoic acid export membrane protein